MAGIGVSPMTARQRSVLVVSALLAVVAFVVIAQLNEVLAASRVNGSVAGSIADLSVSLVPAQLPDQAEILGVVNSWRSYDVEVVQAQPQLGYASPVATANAVLRWDAFVLVPAYALFALSLLWWARSWPPAAPAQPGPRALRAVARSKALFVALVVGVVADLAENLIQSQLIDHAWNGRPLGGLTWLIVTGALKWLALGLVLAPFAIVAVRLAVPLVRPVLRTAWFTVGVIVLLAMLVLTDQASDAIRRWGLGQTIWSLLGTGLLAASAGLAASRQFQIGRTPVTVRAQGRPLTFRTALRAATALIPLLVLAGLLAVTGGLMDWRGLSLLAGVLVATYVLSVPLRHFWEGEQTVEVPTVQTAPAPLRQRLGVVLGALVPLLVGIAVLRASVVDVFAYRGEGLGGEVLLLGFGAALAVPGTVAVALALSVAIRWLAAGGRVRRWSTLAVLALLVAIPGALLYLRSTSATVAQGLGAVPVALVFLSGLCVLAAGLYVVADSALRTRWTREAVLPPAVRLLGFERPPVVGVLVLWLVLASLLGPGSYHDVRLLRRAEVDVRDAALTEFLTEWMDRQPEISQPEPVLPMLVVAASGGGLQSAYFTSVVLDCVFERETDPSTGDPCGQAASRETIARRQGRAFAMSGVAGGSLGLVVYDTHTEVDGLTAEPLWYEPRLQDDFFAPTLAWWLFRDSLATLLRPTNGRDRAAALERAWEAPWRRDGDALAEPFLTRQSRMRGPLLFLNSYTVEDGCRLSVAVVRTAAGRPIDQCGTLDPAFALATDLDGTTDLRAFLCADVDVRRSTAALLSARFPWISPSGQLVACGPEDASLPRAFALQGGLRDASGASTIVELWPAVQSTLDTASRAGACIVPLFLQIDDDDLLPPPGSDRQPSQAVVPVQGLQQVPAGNADAARVAAQRLFSGPFGAQQITASYDGQVLDTRWFRVSPRAHPGTSSEEGWVLSDNAREDLRRQVVYSTTTIERLRRLLDAPEGFLTCDRGIQP